MDIRVKTAKNAAEQYIRRHTVCALPHPLSSEISGQQACYVYVYQKPGQRCRAVYGEPFPRYPYLAQEIIANTVKAISNAKFRTISRSDLPTLLYSIAVLEPLMRICNIEQLDPYQYGLYIISDQGKTALILPQRPGIASANDQIATCIREAGINTKQEAVTMYRFKVTYYE